MTGHDPGSVECRLREDAGRIRTQVSPALRARIDAAWHAVSRSPAALRTSSPRRVQLSSWWASGLTGVAAALLIILLLDRNGEETIAPLAAEYPVQPPALPDRFGHLELNARTAELTAPLEQELENLQADLERARRNVERDLRSTF
ncbi:MAG: hypothetical protein ACREQZ_09865 [Woeseiaceae bacterium]